MKGLRQSGRARARGLAAQTLAVILALLPGLSGCGSDEPLAPAGGPTGQVSGQVYRDDEPYTGMTVTLTDVRGGTRTTTTNANGYQFLEVPAGPARVRLTVPTGLVLASPDSAEKSVIVPAGSGVIGPFFMLEEEVVPPPELVGTLVVNVLSSGAGVPNVFVGLEQGAPPVLVLQDKLTDAEGRAEFAIQLEYGTEITTRIIAPAGFGIVDPPGSPQLVHVADDSTSTLTFQLAPTGGLPGDTPLNDTPQNTMIRFERAYEYQVHEEYDKLFAGNFVFHFSAQSDPDLVTQYGNNWGAKFESDAAVHLFDGFVNDDGDPIPGATRIDMSFAIPPTYGDHPDFDLDSLVVYEWAVAARLVLDIEVAGSPEPIVYSVDARQEFYLVRGEVAALRPGQEARADRWYIYRWDDMSAPLPGRSRALARWMPASPVTWGSVKALYLR